MNATDLYLVRHGESVANSQLLVSGQRDTPLSDTGRAQAREAKQHLQGIAFDRVITSDLSRAVDTARLIAGPEAHIEQYPDLRERDFGNLESRPVTEFHDLLKIYTQTTKDKPFKERWQLPLREDIESDEQVFERVEARLRALATKYAGQKLLVVCHSGPIRLLVAGLGLASIDDLPAGSLQNGGWVHLRFQDGGFTLQSITGVDKDLSLIE